MSGGTSAATRVMVPGMERGPETRQGVTAAAAETAAVVAAALGQPLGAEPPEWIELAAVGEIRADTAMIGPGRYTLTDPAAVIAASLAGDGQLLVDIDHGSEKGGSTAAAGWIDRLEVRPASTGAGRSIWGRVAWTEQGRALVASRSYRRISPVMFHDKKTKVVTRIARASLVNNPALGDLAPVAASSRETDTMDLSKIALALGLDKDADVGAIAAAAASLREQATAASERLGRIAAAAGVKPEGDDQGEAKICAAIASPDPSKFVPKTALDELQGQVAALQTSNAERDAESAVVAAKAAGKLAPALESWGRDYAKRDLAGFSDWVKDAPVVVAAGRTLATTPAERKDGELTADEAKIAAACGVSAEAYAKTRKAIDAARTQGEH